MIPQDQRLPMPHTQSRSNACSTARDKDNNFYPLVRVLYQVLTFYFRQLYPGYLET